MKRVYEEPEPDDGRRVLVDRLWPRGVSKEAAHVDDWLKDLTPSNELRTWFHHDPEGRQAEFADRYLRELDGPQQREALERLRAIVEAGPATLVTSAKDVQHSHVPVLIRKLRE